MLRAITIVAAMVGGGLLAAYTLPDALEAVYIWLSTVLRRGVDEGTPDFRQPFTVVATFVFGAIVLGLFAIYAISKLERVAGQWASMSSADRVTFFVGIMLGVGISIPFHMLFFAFGPGAVVGSFVLMFVFIWVSVVMLRGMQDALPWARSGQGRKSNTKVFDTNVIIDGRIYEVARAGFIEGRIYIPQFVLNELQIIADSHDPNRRQRGRRGLDMLKHLQQSFQIEIGTEDHHAGEMGDTVDERLVRLAKALGAQLVTNDFNLNKVAQVHGVPVLNINDLAMALRPVFLPGDPISVEIERPGSQPGQGVGFLEDGTMVVVENAEPRIGERAEVQVTQIHQSAAGRMIFATIDSSEGESRSRQRARK